MPTVRNRIVNLVLDFAAIRDAAGAVRVGRQPRARDLRRIGIDPVDFREISRQ